MSASRRLPNIRTAVAAGLGLLAGCAATVPTVPSAAPTAQQPVQPAPPPPARDGEYLIVTVAAEDTLQSLAARHLGDEGKAWIIADFNKTERIVPGQQLVIPLIHPNPVGVYSNGYQTVPILCYHRFGARREKMVVTAEAFAAQMAYLRDNGYRVVPLSSLPAFLNGEAPLPRRAVVITIDDGYQSASNIAFPILKRFGFPATVFLYSDFVGAADAMGWGEMKKLVASGLIDIQPHSKTHSHLTERQPNESIDAYRKRIAEEIKAPGKKIQQQLKIPTYSFAYPYGETNSIVIAELKNADYRLGATVQSGGNPAFAYPFQLRRTMIYGDQDMEAFVRSLQVFYPVSLK